jgi:hypothetical protein
MKLVETRRFSCVSRFVMVLREARQEILDLSGPERQTMQESYVDTAAERNRTKHCWKLSSDGLLMVAGK